MEPSSLEAGGDVDHRSLTDILATRTGDIDHRNLISLTGSPGETDVTPSKVIGDKLISEDIVSVRTEVLKKYLSNIRSFLYRIFESIYSIYKRHHLQKSKIQIKESPINREMLISDYHHQIWMDQTVQI